MCIPSGSTGFSPASASAVVSRRPWSRVTCWCEPVGPSGPTTGASRENTSRSKRPSSQARAALCWLANPRASTSSRVMPYFCAIRSAAPNWSGMSQGKSGGRELPGPVHGVGAQADTAHGLDAATDADVDGAGPDEVGDEVVGLLGRPALAVDGGGGGLVGQAHAEPRRAGHVGRLLPRLGDTATDDLLHLRRLDPGPLDHLHLGRGEELRRVEPREPSVALADGGAHRLDDHRSCHWVYLREDWKVPGCTRGPR